MNTVSITTYRELDMDKEVASCTSSVSSVGWKERKEAKLRRPSLSSKDSFTSSRVEEKEEKEIRGKRSRRRRSIVRCGVGVGILGGLAPLTPPSHGGKCHSH